MKREILKIKGQNSNHLNIIKTVDKRTDNRSLRKPTHGLKKELEIRRAARKNNNNKG